MRPSSEWVYPHNVCPSPGQWQCAAVICNSYYCLNIRSISSTAPAVEQETNLREVWSFTLVRTFSWLKAPTSTFTFKNLWRHYARLWNFKLREGSFPAVVASLGCAGGPPPGPAWEDPSWLCVCIARQTMVLLSRNNRSPASVNTQINILIHTAGAAATRHIAVRPEIRNILLPNH